jgi:hypothetical protein
MALDSRDKRASSLGWGLAALLVLPAPGTLDQPDRQHVAYSYRGIQADEAVLDPAVDLGISTATWQTTATHTATFQTTATHTATTQTTATHTAEWG